MVGFLSVDFFFPRWSAAHGIDPQLQNLAETTGVIKLSDLRVKKIQQPKLSFQASLNYGFDFLLNLEQTERSHINTEERRGQPKSAKFSKDYHLLDEQVLFQLEPAIAKTIKTHKKAHNQVVNEMLSLPEHQVLRNKITRDSTQKAGLAFKEICNHLAEVNCESLVNTYNEKNRQNAINLTPVSTVLTETINHKITSNLGYTVNPMGNLSLKASVNIAKFNVEPSVNFGIPNFSRCEAKVIIKKENHNFGFGLGTEYSFQTKKSQAFVFLENVFSLSTFLERKCFLNIQQKTLAKFEKLTSSEKTQSSTLINVVRFYGSFNFINIPLF